MTPALNVHGMRESVPLTDLTFIMETLPVGELTRAARRLPLAYQLDGSQEPQENRLETLCHSLKALPPAIVLLEEPERHFRYLLKVAKLVLASVHAGVQVLFSIRTNEMLDAIVLEISSDPSLHPPQTIDRVSVLVYRPSATGILSVGQFIGDDVRLLCRDVE